MKKIIIVVALMFSVAVQSQSRQQFVNDLNKDLKESSSRASFIGDRFTLFINLEKGLKAENGGYLSTSLINAYKKEMSYNTSEFTDDTMNMIMSIRDLLKDTYGFVKATVYIEFYGSSYSTTKYL